MKIPKVYIDGQAGTTGLRIRQWLVARDDIELLSINEADRKEIDARRRLLTEADLSILCLPNEAAREAFGWAKERGARILDASSAHRVASGWVYGLPELAPAQRKAIRQAQWVTNPGCYSSAFILLIRPLIEAGLLPFTVPFTIHALSGYSGGGRQMIERWEDEASSLATLPYEAPYALHEIHKHIPEMTKYAKLENEPQFVPAVGPFRCGMRVQIPLNKAWLGDGVDSSAINACWSASYAEEPYITIRPLSGAMDEMDLDPRRCNDTNLIQLHVLAHPSGHILLVALLDNLGKGASGVAIQNMNLMLGLDETKGLPG